MVGAPIYDEIHITMKNDEVRVFNKVGMIMAGEYLVVLTDYEDTTNNIKYNTGDILSLSEIKGYKTLKELSKPSIE